MIKELRIPLFEMIMCFSDAMDLISPAIVDHHKRVAYISFSMAAELGLSADQQNDLLVAGALHDIGALSLKERLDALEFEVSDAQRHAEVGYLLLNNFDAFSNIAKLVRYHHSHWSDNSSEDLLGGHIIHLADRVSVLINKQEDILGQSKRIIAEVEKHSGTMFKPELVDAFKSLAAKEYFWLDVASASITSVLAHKSKLVSLELNLEKLCKLAGMFCQIIDFRSRFTATHSSGVAATSEALAKLIGFSERECQMIKVAGYLHDLGKLAVPSEILEKPGKLTEFEVSIIKSHTYYTYSILASIKDLEVINEWASFHHERLDGNGYPFHHKNEDISLGARIVAVADVFTAVTEDRPYRKGMDSDTALRILQQMGENQALDLNIIQSLRHHYDEVNRIRINAQNEACENYQRFWSQLGQE